MNFISQFKSILLIGFAAIMLAPLSVADNHEMNKLGFKLDASVGMDVSVFRDDNLDGGFGFQGDVKTHYYFSPYVGVFTGFDFVSRTLTDSNTHDLSMNSLEIPFGISFRQSPSASPIIASIGLGGYYSIPLEEVKIGGVKAETEGNFGMVFSGRTFFPVTESFMLGFGGDIKYAFGGPLKNGDGGFSATLGLASRFSF